MTNNTYNKKNANSMMDLAQNHTEPESVREIKFYFRQCSQDKRNDIFIYKNNGYNKTNFDTILQFNGIWEQELEDCNNRDLLSQDLTRIDVISMYSIDYEMKTYDTFNKLFNDEFVKEIQMQKKGKILLMEDRINTTQQDIIYTTRTSTKFLTDKQIDKYKKFIPADYLILPMSARKLVVYLKKTNPVLKAYDKSKLSDTWNSAYVAIPIEDVIRRLI